MWGLIAAAIGALIAGVVIYRLTVKYLNLANLQEIAQSNKTSETVSAKINQILQSGNHREVNVGLFDSSGTEKVRIEVSAEDISYEIREGVAMAI